MDAPRRIGEAYGNAHARLAFVTRWNVGDIASTWAGSHRSSDVRRVGRGNDRDCRAVWAATRIERSLRLDPGGKSSSRCHVDAARVQALSTNRPVIHGGSAGTRMFRCHCHNSVARPPKLSARLSPSTVVDHQDESIIGRSVGRLGDTTDVRNLRCNDPSRAHTRAS